MTNFRSPEIVKRYEYFFYDLDTSLNTTVGANNPEEKRNHIFTVDNSTEANPIDWYNAYFEVEFKLTKADGNALTALNTGTNTTFVASSNGHTLIKSIIINCNGISVYNNQRASETLNVLNLLKYTKPYVETVGKDQFFYLDPNTGAAQPDSGTAATYNEAFLKRATLISGSGTVKMSIPLNIYSYFAAFKNNLHPNIKTQIQVEFENDTIFPFKRAAVTVVPKVVVTKFRLWCPKIVFNGEGMKMYLNDYLKPKQWKYLREKTFIKETESTSDYLRISTGITRPIHVFIWVVEDAAYTDQKKNPFIFNTFAVGTGNANFTRAQLEINNSIYYPQLELTKQEETRLYRELMSFNSAYNDVLSGPLIDRTNFKNLFGILYFNLRNQEEDIKNGVVSLTFRYELDGAPGSSYRINASILHEEIIELYTSSGKLIIKI